MKKALITGITGQDGSYLAEHLMTLGYQVHGIKRRSSSFNTERINHIYDSPEKYPGHLTLHYGDVVDSLAMFRLISTIRPDEIYNLAAQSHVKVSFETPEYTANADGVGVLRILEAIRQCELAHQTKFYQASTSEIFGKSQEVPQNESTPFYPRSPYGVSKLFGYWATVNYREAYSIFASNGILFNHESPRRGGTFVTQKIVDAAVRYSKGYGNCLYLGNIYAQRDWGHASDFVKGMHSILQHDRPDDFVLATGRTETVKKFVEITYAFLDINIEWEGEGIDEVGRDSVTGAEVVRIDQKYFRPTEVDVLQGDATKARKSLGWKPQVSLEELILEMIEECKKTLETGNVIRK